MFRVFGSTSRNIGRAGGHRLEGCSGAALEYNQRVGGDDEHQAEGDGIGGGGGAGALRLRASNQPGGHELGILWQVLSGDDPCSRRRSYWGEDKRFDHRAKPQAGRQCRHTQMGDADQQHLHRLPGRQADRRRVEGDLATRADGQHRRGEHDSQLCQPQFLCRCQRCQLGNDQAGQHGYPVQELRQLPGLSRGEQRQHRVAVQREGQGGLWDQFGVELQPAARQRHRLYLAGGRRAEEHGAVFDRQSRGRPNYRGPQTLSAGGVVGDQVGAGALLRRLHAGDPLRPLRGLESVCGCYQRHFSDPAGTITLGKQADARRNTEDGSVNSKDTANQLVLVYKMGIHSFEADLTTKKYSESNVTPTATGKFQQYKNNSYMLLMENRWTNAWRTAFSYIKAAAGSCKLASLTNVPCNTTGLEGAQISAGVAYYLDPSAYVFGLFTKVKNGTSAQYNNLALQKPNPGEDITSGAIGFAYTF